LCAAKTSVTTHLTPLGQCETMSLYVINVIQICNSEINAHQSVTNCIIIHLQFLLTSHYMYSEAFESRYNWFFRELSIKLLLSTVQFTQTFFWETILIC
jgi:hypothetical protein